VLRTISEDPDTACFDVRGLRRIYGTGPAAVEALRGVDLQIPERELVVILGASGSGKSTFLNIIGGLNLRNIAAGMLASSSNSTISCPA
jgi:ABC-type lipoprotein export system ATPase subunit